ncbi:FAD-dependent monooxygenase [Streptomyces sioyaensis]|uniref:FAD-dependent monooxygenase n=1 Tax=Streptomyces sioyaensis TaxID=67364 RepID=UPI0033EBA5F8
MKAVICGAGIAGLALAQRLDALGWEVVVLEKAPGPRPQGYMIDFFGPGYDAAEAMELLPRLQELAYPVQEAASVDHHGRTRARLTYEQFGRAVRGRLLSLMRPDLEQALRESLSGRVDLRFATTIRHLDNQPTGVHLALTNGSTLAADLLVGADGIHSTVRSLAHGDEERYVRYLGFHTAAFVFDDPEVHSQVRDRFCLTDTLGRQMGFYGLRDGKVAAFAVHRTPDPALPADARRALLREYAGLGWVVPRALERCPPADCVYYDRVAQIELPQWSSGRVTLVGDACQAVSLLAGQGASLGIAGAYVLAEQLHRGPSIEAAMESYERIWRPVIADKQRTARKAARWFIPGAAWQLHVRRGILKAAGLPGVNRYVGVALAGKPTSVVTELQGAARPEPGRPESPQL